MIQTNADILSAFPTAARIHAEGAIKALPDNPSSFQTFSVRVNGENIVVPQRIRHDPLAISVSFRLGLRSKLEGETLDCIFTRHSSGFVRQKHLGRIIRSNNVWIPPFVIQLAGEYVIQILRDIERALPHLDSAVYGNFAQQNPEFMQKTKHRIASYWDCYYRSILREEYPGFCIQAFFEELEKKGPACAGPKANS